MCHPPYLGRTVTAGGSTADLTGDPTKGQVSVLIFVFFLVPTCQVRVVRFYQGSSPSSLTLLSSPPPPHPPRLVFSSIPAPDRSGQCGNAGPQQQAPDRSGHCRTSTASARSQWGTAGPQQQAPDHSGEDRTSTTSTKSWAILDLNSKRQEWALPHPSSQLPIAVASTASTRSQRALPNLNSNCQIAVGTSCLKASARGKLHRCRMDGAEEYLEGCCKQPRPLVTEVPQFENKN